LTRKKKGEERNKKKIVSSVKGEEWSIQQEKRERGKKHKEDA
jgi:hypothetical protein